MGILATEILIRTMLEAAIADLRNNSWLLEDVFGELATDPISQLEFGYKEVKQAVDWFNANKIAVIQAYRSDPPVFPCITIKMEQANEKVEQTFLGDEGQPVTQIQPRKARRTIQKIIPDCSIAGYNSKDRIVTIPKDIAQKYGNGITAGQYLVSNITGKGFLIEQVNSISEFVIASSAPKDCLQNIYIAPSSAVWNEHKETTYFNEAFSLGVHASSEPKYCYYMRQLLTYILLRYKEVYLEGRGFEVSTFSVGAVELNEQFPADKIYSSFLNLSGVTQSTWIKFIAPRFERVDGGLLIDKAIVSDTGIPTPYVKPTTPSQYLDEAEDQGWKMSGDEIEDVPLLGEDD